MRLLGDLWDKLFEKSKAQGDFVEEFNRTILEKEKLEVEILKLRLEKLKEGREEK